MQEACAGRFSELKISKGLGFFYFLDKDTFLSALLPNQEYKQELVNSQKTRQNVWGGGEGGEGRGEGGGEGRGGLTGSG